MTGMPRQRLDAYIEINYVDPCKKLRRKTNDRQS